MLKRLSKINNSILLVSNPCIEFWFLLHYKNQTATISNVKCCKEMENRNKTYDKGIINTKLKEKLKEKINNAAERAKKLKAFDNPSSSVYRLIEVLNELKK